MTRNSLPLVILLSIFFITACSPKVQDTVVAPPVKEEVAKELDPNGCIQFNDLGLEKADQVSDDYNLYRDRIKEKDFKAAYPMWKNVYENAPSTNGRIDYVFRDGLKIYTDLYNNTSDTQLQDKYVDTMMMIYDKAVICFPKKKSYYMSKQGKEFFYTYKNKLSNEEIYKMLKEAVEMDGNESRVSTIIPLSSLNYRLYSNETITVDDARSTMENVNGIVEYNSKNCKDTKTCNAWTQVEQYTVELSDRYENKKGFFDCNYFMDKYYADYEAQPENCDLIEDLYRKLRKAGCAKEEPRMVALVTQFKGKCQAPPPTSPLARCRQLLEEERYQEAVTCYEEYVNSISDPEKKARYLLRIAKIYYAHLNKFSKSREYARRAMKHKSNWGEPLILIGKLYASSGPLCGPGTGFDSQIVTWPAIDKWNQAKRADPNVASEANKLIRRYEKFMPSKADIFQRSLKTGGTFKVKCWIQENTKIRPAQ